MQIQKQAEITRFLETISAEKRVDLEAWETSLRRTVLAAGARVLAEALCGIGSGRRPIPVVCTCGHRMESVGLREKTLRTILGPVPFRRSLFVCQRCGASRFPADELLDMENTGFSPGARRMMTRAGSRTPFAEAQEDLRIYANLHVDAKDIERVTKHVGADIEAWMGQKNEQAIQTAGAGHPAPNPKTNKPPILYIAFDGTGIPMRREELAGRKGKHPDGTAKTREVKLGCVFTQTSRDEQGHPVRDPASTTYVGAIETSDAFGWRLYAETLQRGLESAQKVVVLTDGASYNKSIIDLHFPQAIHIIDLYHTREHLYEISALLVSEAKREIQEKKWLDLLDQGHIETLVKVVQRYLPRNGKRRKAALGHIQYFLRNAEQMRYGLFREQGFFVGSGVIEAGCRTVIGQRLKNSGMFWSLPGANAVIACRCCLYSGRFEQFWEDRVA